MPERKTLERARAQTPRQVGVHASRRIHTRGNRACARRQARRALDQQAVAIGLSKARRAGVKLPAPKHASAAVKRKAERT